VKISAVGAAIFAISYSSIVSTQIVARKASIRMKQAKLINLSALKAAI
jgi:hypothetical protein